MVHVNVHGPCPALSLSFFPSATSQTPDLAFSQSRGSLLPGPAERSVLTPARRPVVRGCGIAFSSKRRRCQVSTYDSVTGGDPTPIMSTPIMPHCALSRWSKYEEPIGGRSQQLTRSVEC